MNQYINRTLELMNYFGFETRDTFSLDCNYDDFYENNSSYNGLRHFDVVWISDGYPGVNAERKYSIQNFESVAYNKYKIEMPERYRALERGDIVYHETTHFLQKNTVENEENYIKFNGTNYVDYITQRCEYEAHLVQIKYIIDDMNEYFYSKVPEKEIKTFLAEASSLSAVASTNKGIGLSLIMKAKQFGVI